MYENFQQKNLRNSYHERPEESFSPSLALGYDINKNFSVEILGSFTRLKWEHEIGSHINSQNMNLYSFFINTYFKYPLKRNITTYFTLDPGYTFNKSSTIVSREENTNFVLTAPGKKNRSLIWNIGVGSILKLKKNIFMDIAYRYTTLGKISHKARGVFIPDQSERVNAHTISIGLMYKFY